MWLAYWNRESPSMPIMDSTPNGSNVSVITTIRIFMGIGISISSGYPTSATRTPVSTAFLTSSIPPKILPESV